MRTGLTQQLAGYGDHFAAEVDALARETIMTTDQDIIPIDRDENDKKKSPWLRVGALVGAAAVIIASIVGLTVLRSDSDDRFSAVCHRRRCRACKGECGGSRGLGSVPCCVCR